MTEKKLSPEVLTRLAGMKPGELLALVKEKLEDSDELTAQSAFAIAFEITNTNLQTGRALGNQRKTARARSNRKNLEKAIRNLFKSGQGWRMTNDEIASFLLERNLHFGYTKNTILQYVKKPAAQARKDETQDQARKLPKW